MIVAATPSAHLRSRRRALLASAALAAAALARALPAVAAEPFLAWTGGPTPALRARTLDGAPLSLDDFRGRVAIVNFWATWCAPCVAEMPALQLLRDRLAPDGVEVIAVNYQENAARIRPFLTENMLSFPVVRDHDGTLRTAWRVTVFPSSFVVGRDGRIAWYATGEVDWNDRRVEALIRGLR